MRAGSGIDAPNSALSLVWLHGVATALMETDFGSGVESATSNVQVRLSPGATTQKKALNSNQAQTQTETMFLRALAGRRGSVKESASTSLQKNCLFLNGSLLTMQVILSVPNTRLATLVTKMFMLCIA